MIDIITSVGGVLLVLSLLVIIHELGHYIAAKYFGVAVHEFGVGYPPKAVKLFRRWQTDFTLNWLPLGGFVRLDGEERAVEDRDDDPKKFYNKTAWQRIIVLFAGPAVNLIFGVVVFSALFTFTGIPEVTPIDDGLVVTGILPDSPAAEAELNPGDKIVGLQTAEGDFPVTQADSFIELVNGLAGQEVVLEYIPGAGLESAAAAQAEQTRVYIRTPDEVPAGQGALGVAISNSQISMIQYPWYEMPIRGAYTGIISSIMFAQEIVTQLVSMVGMIFVGQVPQDVAGIVGIVDTVHDQELFNQGWSAIFNFIALISFNLGILNLLPIPALDGGRILFILIEKFSFGLFKPEHEQYANIIGMGLLIVLIILVTAQDISRIWPGLF